MSGLIERGIVIRSGGGTVDVRMSQKDACAKCSACCHVDRDGVTIEGAIDRIGAAQGDEVEVEIPEGADTTAGLLVFALPAAGLLLGYALGYLLFDAAGLTGDFGGALGAVGAIAVALVLLRKRGRDALASTRYRPRVRDIIAPAQSASPPQGADRDGPTGASERPPTAER